MHYCQREGEAQRIIESLRMALGNWQTTNVLDVLVLVLVVIPDVVLTAIVRPTGGSRAG